MKTEKEKMLAGEIYDANYDKQLLAERAACQQACFELNQLPPKAVAERSGIVSKLFGKVGENFTVVSPFYCDYGYNIKVGDNVFINMDCVMLDGGGITLGNNVFIAPQCGFYTAGHPLDAERRNKGLEYARPITIGDNVWIGGHVCVMPGVTIGDNSVIGGGSVIVHDIPAGVLAVGNPCRVIRKL